MKRKDKITYILMIVVLFKINYYLEYLPSIFLVDRYFDQG